MNEMRKGVDNEKRVFEENIKSVNIYQEIRPIVYSED